MKNEKQFLLDEIKEKIEASKAMFLTSYVGFNANKNADFRDMLHKTGSDLEMVRKRVFIKAAAQAGIEFTRAELEGHVAIVFANEDPLQTTKELCKFTKDNNEIMQIIAGHFDGKLVGKEDVIALSKLPSMDQMRAQFVGLLQAPMSQTLGVMQSLLVSVMQCMDQKAKKQENV